MGEPASAKCVADGDVCYKGSSCDDCCSNTHGYWYTNSLTSCGKEPCIKTGEDCGRWSSCKICCVSEGRKCPWWGFVWVHVWLTTSPHFVPRWDTTRTAPVKPKHSR